MTIPPGAASAFDHGLRGGHCWLESESGQRVELPVGTWHNDGPDAGDELMLARCDGATIDIGCGPGRLTATLAQRGIAAFGIDTSQVAVELVTLRGARAACHDIFSELSVRGRWQHALLADGNIGGEPHSLLRRIRILLTSSGTVLAEVEPHSKPLRSEFVRVAGHGSRSGWFRWAWLGAGAVPQIAHDLGMSVTWLGSHNDRWFAELTPEPSSAAPGPATAETADPN